MYDYLEAMKVDVKNYIDNTIILSDYSDREELEQYLNDTLWDDDSVTGNGSGSYTFSREEAKGYVIDNMDFCKEAVENFCVSNSTVVEKFLNENWEYFDVSIRCYLLGSAISEVLDEMEYELEEVFEEEEEE